MRRQSVSHDVTVVGGGLAGVCAAIAAARLGASVTLIGNRPVLGGNSSSEVRVWVCGATAHGVQRFARETGIMGELLVENQYRNPEGNPYYWDQVVLDAVRGEPGVSLYLNTDVHEVETSADRAIESVTGWTMGAERETRFSGPFFLDCTGDGLIGALAGADYRIGREASAEYGESWAPPEPDSNLLGSTILFYTKDTGRPERYVPPSIAKDITKTPIPENRIIRSGDSGAAYWWIEWGGRLDTVDDNEAIRDELWSVIYGIWDYIKNSGRFDADTLTLEWVGSIPGKREYRRLLGDHVLTQNDVVWRNSFPDPVAFGGWALDLHPVDGMYAADPASRHMFGLGVYDIPFRCLYSRNVPNLLMAGRDISASHVAFGSTRVMATCAVEGEAAGTAAAMCASRGVTPRVLGSDYLDELLAQLARQDASVVGPVPAAVRDKADLAQQALVSASSTLTELGAVPGPGQEAGSGLAYSLAERDVAILFPVDPRLDELSLLVSAAVAASLRAELWSTGDGRNYVPVSRVAAVDVPVKAGPASWVRVPLSYEPPEPCNVICVVRSNPAASLMLCDDRPYGVLSLLGRRPSDGPPVAFAPVDDGPPQLLWDWDPKPLRRRAFGFRACPQTAAYEPAKVTDGHNRPFGGPHLWCSAPAERGNGEQVVLDWTAPVTVSSVEVIFNDDVDEDLVNLHHHRSPYQVVPELVRDYRVEILDPAGQWRQAAAVAGNRKRRRAHRLPGPARARAVRLAVEATHGAPCAQVTAIRVY